MDDDHGLQLAILRKNILVIKEPVCESKPELPVNPGCVHGGHPDFPADLCDACYIHQMKALNRFGLWKTVREARPSRHQRPV
jgi:hypothetical protein